MFMLTHDIPILVVFVFDDEDHVETREDGGHEVDIVVRFGVIPAAEYGVGGCEDRAARVQRRRYTRLENKQFVNHLSQKMATPPYPPIGLLRAPEQPL